jgi:hypothetical protein
VSATQSTKLLSSLFENIDNEQRLTVLHMGPALPETVEFFSRFRCKLYFVDLFSELPIAIAQEEDPPQEQVFSELLNFQPNVEFDVCLFWDLFNFLDSEAIAAFLHVLQPHLHADTVAHGFAVHNLKSPQGDQLYGIKELDLFNVRRRETALPGYSPHPQAKLKSMLNCFNFDRSVLLPDSRLELLFSASL